MQIRGRGISIITRVLVIIIYCKDYNIEYTHGTGYCQKCMTYYGIESNLHGNLSISRALPIFAGK